MRFFLTDRRTGFWQHSLYAAAHEPYGCRDAQDMSDKVPESSDYHGTF